VHVVREYFQIARFVKDTNYPDPLTAEKTAQRIERDAVDMYSRGERLLSIYPKEQHVPETQLATDTPVDEIYMHPRFYFYPSQARFKWEVFKYIYQ